MKAAWTSLPMARGDEIVKKVLERERLYVIASIMGGLDAGERLR